jgi:hypothetical protein
MRILATCFCGLLVACAAPDATVNPPAAEPRPFPELGVEPYLAKLESAGLNCGPPPGDEPTRSCAAIHDPGVDSIGVSIHPNEGELVLRVYAYVAAPGRPDFDDYATTFFRDVVMPTLLEPDELPSFAEIRTAAQTSGKIVVGNFVFQFLESSTTRAVQITYRTS